MSKKIEWKPVTIQIKQQGRGTWLWKVWFTGQRESDYFKSGNQCTRRGAIRRAKRYRTGVLVDG